MDPKVTGQVGSRETRPEDLQSGEGSWKPGRILGRGEERRVPLHRHQAWLAEERGSCQDMVGFWEGRRGGLCLGRTFSHLGKPMRASSPVQQPLGGQRHQKGQHLQSHPTCTPGHEKVETEGG